MSALREIDAAIEGLDDALRSAGLPGLEAPSDPRAVDAVADAVVPYELPAELRRFWERVDPERMEVYTFPTLGGPAAALELQQSLREYGAPPVLLPIDYASHCFGVIELGSEWTEGGTILEWDFDGFPLVARSVADRLAVLAELLLEGLFERGDGFVSLDHRAEREKRLARLDAFGPIRRTETCARSRASSSRGRPTGFSRVGSTSETASPSARPIRLPSSSPQQARAESRAGSMHT
jgi:hypothetical protein